MSLSVILIVVNLLFPPDSLTPSDSGRRANRIRPTFNLDFRNSFLDRQRVNVWGVNAGIEFGAKRHQLTLGYYWLNYATYLRLINWRRDAARRINLAYYTRTDLWFTSVQYWWNMTNNKRWMVSIPVELGGGVAYAVPRDLRQDVQVDRTRRDFFVPLQVGAYAQWKATRWIGFSGQIGYRYSVFQTDINQNFNGTYYSVGLTIYPALLTDVWRFAAKGDHISPVRPPRPHKLKRKN
ncbi:hypothetical protein [Spirosoma utsteinense]|uniref:DUF3575 domain-containing protein n=1 Tax=Spirosoma utsteinense TaxID=2585773 RepID=A0ABR6W8I3_9BACT|nr:hypothetical protein [Spirosoma utsteinense]MBC3787205.1 hypothetical protein [Spirosoma utsteinense]MBC3792890.1 hypothetical protein [Spirosoma utsteinense]